MAAYLVTFRRIKDEYMKVEVEADTPEQAKAKAVVIAETQPDEFKDWFQGDPEATDVVLQEPS